MVSKGKITSSLGMGIAALVLAGCGKSEPGVSAPAFPAAFASCTACHSAEQQGGNRVGPNLYGIVGRKAGSLPGFRYSAAMRDSNVVWNAETLDRFLEAPQAMMPGVRMMQSVPDAPSRSEIITYLSGQAS